MTKISDFKTIFKSEYEEQAEMISTENTSIQGQPLKTIGRRDITPK